MWKDYFYYSRSERRAIVVLLLLVVMGFGGLFLWRGMPGARPDVGREESARIDSFLAGVKAKERRFVRGGNVRKEMYGSVPVRLDFFDPNTADSARLRSLGLSAFVARNILRYREKGGVFRDPDALSRVYGMTDSQFVALRPYVRIASAFSVRGDVPVRETVVMSEKEHLVPVGPAKLPEGSTVPLNQADTSLLKRIPGIGSGLARMIVAYRHRLGGFSRIEQLQEIPYLDMGLNRWFELKDGPYRKLRVNRDGLDRLRNHPYMDFYKAKAIIEYRRKRGRIKGMARIAMFEEFSEADMQRLAPYFSFD